MPVKWVVPILAAAAMLLVLEVANRLSPPLAWAVAVVALVAIVVRLVILRRRKP